MTTWLRENRAFLVFLLCFGFFRTAVADWNPVPTGSMRPTIVEGDVVLVNRLAYDLKLPLTDRALARLGEPRRGDIVTFSSPANGTRLIKRVVALPGDVVEMRDEVLFVNHQPARYAGFQQHSEPLAPAVHVPATRAREQLDGHEHTVQFLPSVGARRSFAPVTVPADHVFVLGDNRDNSEDSRYIGTVPRHLLIGRAHHVLVSADITGSWLPRLGRTLSVLQ
ncbi:signal peptidase I [Ideonella sp. DXS22W]|uniref:Signal peptidase I n=1 Tax=Pseudaquabacterium inlustre TaxID=2984192 RepID=A0ABU9CG72_9BURK